MPRALLHPVVAIVQARLGSTRLPLKSLLSLRDQPVINWVLHRLSQAKKIDSILFAIPDTSLDAVLHEHLRRQQVSCFVGSETDVLERYVMAARSVHAGTVIRVCADNPLIWGEAVDRLIDFYASTPCDYAYNHIPRNNRWPDGLGAEILSRDLLEEIATKANLPAQREHCLNYIWDTQDTYRIATFDPKESWLCRPDLKLDIDRIEDYQKLALLPIHMDMDASEIVTVCTDVSA